MTPTTTRLNALGLTARRFAAIIGAHPVTVSYWGRKRPGRDVQEEPTAVRLLLDAWERHPDLIPRDKPLQITAEDVRTILREQIVADYLRRNFPRL